MSVVLIPCLPPGVHPGMDALAFGLAEELEGFGHKLLVASSDLREPDMPDQQASAVYAALDGGAAGIVLFVVDPFAASADVSQAMARGIPVVAIHRPAFAVSACVLVPNYYHGVAIADAMGRHLAVGATVGVVGGPEIIDDIEMVEGVVSGLRRVGLRLLNDPFERRYRNLDDVVGAGGAAVDAVMDDHGPMDGLVVFNDETLRDALPRLEARPWSKQVVAMSRNGSPDVVDWVRRGRTTATYDYHLPEIGRTAAQAVQAALQAPAVIERSIMAPVGQLITAEVADRYTPWDQRAHPRRLPLLEVARHG